MPKPILFVDFDGVLCDDRFWRGLGKADYDRIQEFFIHERHPMLEKWMRGGHTSEEVNQYLADNLSIPYEKLWNIFVEDAKTMNVPVPTLKRIENLKEYFQTVLITVNMDSLDRFTVPALSLDSYFDLIVNSYNDGRFKSENDGEIFVDVAKNLNASINDSYLIDDRDNNCDVFVNLGGTSLKVDAENSTDSHLDSLLSKVSV